MKRMWVVMALAALVAGCGAQGDDAATVAEDAVEAAADHGDKAAMTEDAHGSIQDQLEKADPVGSYGAGVTLEETVSIASILAAPDGWEGKQVRVAGTVTEVCPKAGCWMEIAGDGETIRVKVRDGDIVFPKSAEGHPAVVEGVVEKLELDEEQTRAWKQHEAEETGKPFDPASVTGPSVTWRLRGLGAEIAG